MAARLITDGLNFPECARWRDGEIWFVDTPYLKAVTRSGQVHKLAELPAKLVLGLAFTADGAALVGDALGRRVYRVGTAGDVELAADLSEHFAYGTNELAATPDGSVYVGSMGFDILHGATPQVSRLARIDATGQISQVGQDVLFPNGLALSADARTLYVAESFASRITTFAIAPDGSLGQAATFADVTGRDAHHPDGICLDPGGGVWYADPAGGVIVLVSAGGDELRRIRVPLPHPTSCAVGGPDDELLIVTATAAMATPDLEFSGVGALFTLPRDGS